MSILNERFVTTRSSLPSMFTMEPFDLLRTSSFALMRRLSEEMDDYFAQLGMGRGGSGMAAGSGVLSPPVEVLEREGNLIVRVDLPGLSKDDVRVEGPSGARSLCQIASVPCPGACF